MIASADHAPFAALLPHSVFLDPDDGLLLLSTPRPFFAKPTVDVGCAWAVQSRNIEVVDEAVCTDTANIHQSLLRQLPVGASLQTLMTIAPSTTVPAWEQLRAAQASDPLLGPIIDAQTAAIRHGLPHKDQATACRLRNIPTIVTLRVPVLQGMTGIPAMLRTALALPGRRAAALAAQLTRHLTAHLEAFAGLRQGVEETLRLAGHGVIRLGSEGLGAAVVQALQPMGSYDTAILPDIPLQEQVLLSEATTEGYGVTMGQGKDTVAAQVLSLHRSPPQTYPGMLSAPRAPSNTTPLALWDAWEYPLTLAVNVAAVDQEKEKGRLRHKRTVAGLQSKISIENAEIKKELDGVLSNFFLSGEQLFWGRVHAVLWGPPSQLRRGTEDLIRAANRLKLAFVPEHTLGGTLFLQTLPLGFDQGWPRENFLNRARRLPSSRLSHLLLLYGGMQSTRTAGVLYVNRRGEAVTTHPYDSDTNPHMLVLGTSGAGKTYHTVHFLEHVLPLGGSAIVIDPVGNYKALCDYWGGEYIKVDLDHPVCMNPFYGPLDNAHNEFATASIAEMARGTEPFPWLSYSVLGDAVGYQARTWTRQRGEPTMSQFVKEVLLTGAFNPDDPEARRVARDIALRLSLFYGNGTYAGLVDGQNAFRLHNRLTILDISAFTKKAETLQGIMFFNLLHLLSQFFEDPARRFLWKYLIVDEVWKPLKEHNTAEVFERIIRTYRNMRTSAMFIGHRAEDFESPVGGIIRALTDTKLFLKQESSELPALQKVFHLRDAEMQLFPSVQKHDGWSSGFLRLGDQAGGIVRILSDRLTAFLASQDWAVAQRREQAIAQAGGDVRQAMLHLLAEEARHA